MTMRKLYKIWLVKHNVNRPAPKSSPYVVAENGNWAYPLISIIGVIANRWCRGDFVSPDRAKLKGTTAYLNEIADSDEHYEIREELVEV